MEFQPPEWFTIDGLAEWYKAKGYSVTKEFLNLYVQTRELKVLARFTHEEFEDKWLVGPAEDYKEDWAGLNMSGYDYAGDCVKRVEAERFSEALGLATGNTNQGESKPGKQAHETDKEMVKRLKQEGFENKQIAHKLKDAFPKIYPSRIGKLITEEPGVFVTNGAYRKRGIRLLK